MLGRPRAIGCKKTRFVRRDNQSSLLAFIVVTETVFHVVRQVPFCGSPQKHRFQIVVMSFSNGNLEKVQLNNEELQKLLNKMSSDERKELTDTLRSCTSEVGT